MSTLANYPAVVNNAKSTCTGCGSDLPLREVNRGEIPALWNCARCHSVFSGVINEDADPDLRFNIYPHKVHFDCRDLVREEAELTEFINGLPLLPGAADKRTSPRHCVAIVASIMPLDEEGLPAGAAFMVVLRNISAGGISFTHPNFIDEGEIAVELPNSDGGRLRTKARLNRKRALGRHYEYGAEFLTS